MDRAHGNDSEMHDGALVDDPTRAQVLLSRMIDGDPQALDALLRTYGRRLGSIAFAIVGSDDLAEEVVQDVFLRLWEARDILQIQGSVAHYLFRATRNQALNVLRRERSQWDRADQAGIAIPAERRSVQNQALDRLSAEDLRRTVYAALRGVPPRCREIFLLNWESELNYAEIAELLGVSLPTIHNQMSRAVKQLAVYFKTRM